MTGRPGWAVWLAALALLFGLATVVSGGAALFGGPGPRAAAGDAVPFVLWFNFLAGFAYLAGAVGLYLWQPWTETLAWAIALATLAIYAAFGLAIAAGTAFEMRTVFAMVLRAGFWLVIAFALSRRRRAADRGARDSQGTTP